MRLKFPAVQVTADGPKLATLTFLVHFLKKGLFDLSDFLTQNCHFFFSFVVVLLLLGESKHLFFKDLDSLFVSVAVGARLEGTSQTYFTGLGVKH